MQRSPREFSFSSEQESLSPTTDSSLFEPPSFSGSGSLTTSTLLITNNIQTRVGELALVDEERYYVEREGVPLWWSKSGGSDSNGSDDGGDDDGSSGSGDGSSGDGDGDGDGDGPPRLVEFP
ncbi:hypothetical protein V1478_000682 [Vespula squamosa]|uniref:Uncharacterized protein n=1 Tax=Vespula squamosa TaxID=30214 RepID=A0ABD2C663_VESSQ